jgi:hypothetical protein
MMALMGVVAGNQTQAAIFYEDSFENTLASSGWTTGSCNPSDPNPSVDYPNGCNPTRSTDVANQGTNSLKGTYTGTDSGVWIDHTFSQTTEIYHRFYYRTANFVYNTPGTKNFFMGDGAHYPNFWVNHYMGSREFSVYMQVGSDTQPPCPGADRDCIYTPNIASVPINDGQWYCIEDHIKLNTPGQANGVVEMWVNGIQTVQYLNRTIVSTTPDCNGCSSSNSAFNYNRIFVQHGTGLMYYDNFAVGNTRIGCSGISNTPAPSAPTGLTVR